MKKVFLLAAVAFATSANAQLIQIDATAQGLNPDDKDTPVELAEGTVLGTNDAIDVAVAFKDNYKIVDNKAGGYNQIIFDGNVAVTKNGLQGQTNPKDADGNGPALTPKQPISGAYTLVTAKADGYVYVGAKLSSNKSYVIFEEGASIGYKFALELDAASEQIGGNTLMTGELTDEAAAAPINWLVRIVTGNAEATTEGNGLGILAFPVYKDCKYLVGASGSKITQCSFYYKADDSAKIELADEKAEKASKVIYEGSADPSGIANVASTAKAENARMFNLAGQEVGKNFKGIVVVNGKKFMNK